MKQLLIQGDSHGWVLHGRQGKSHLHLRLTIGGSDKRRTKDCRFRFFSQLRTRKEEGKGSGGNSERVERRNRFTWSQFMGACTSLPVSEIHALTKMTVVTHFNIFTVPETGTLFQINFLCMFTSIMLNLMFGDHPQLITEGQVLSNDTIRYTIHSRKHAGIDMKQGITISRTVERHANACLTGEGI